MNIHQTIIAVMSDISAISKDKRNEGQKFMYRGIDDVMNELSPLFKKHGLYIVPEVLSIKRELQTTSQGKPITYSLVKVKYTYTALDGTSVVAIGVGEGMDSGDKSINKALSIAFKYSLFQVFCIPTEEMKDPDAEAFELMNLKEEAIIAINNCQTELQLNDMLRNKRFLTVIRDSSVIAAGKTKREYFKTIGNE